MKAAVIRRHGGPKSFEYSEIEAREPHRGELSVRVLACALNHLDVFVRRGMPGVELELPHIAGGDIVGIVERAGNLGDETLLGKTVLVDPLVDRRALGEQLWGGLAEYTIIPADNAIVLPEGAEPKIFAALPIAYGTARRMLFERARIEPGETVVVLGAAGGVGVACVQLASKAGARVIAGSSSESKRLGLAGLGAEVVDTSGDWGSEVWRLTSKRGADVVLDSVGRETWATSIRCTRRGGRVVTCGATSGFDAVTDLRYVWTRELHVVGSDGWTRADLEALVGSVASGELRPVIHASYPLSRIRDAVADLEERRAFGKVIVVPDRDWI